MVTFKGTSLNIEYTAGCCPVEEWQGLVRELIWVFSELTPEQMPKEGLWRLHHLMEAMLPDPEVARKMIEK
ncbi:MAG: hypothetical protein IKY80_05260 [Alistipes sp.]|nr:hypothetical protein [Alistipes sp.]